MRFPSRPRILRQNDGAVGVLSALTLAAVFGFASLVLDIGLAYDQKRQQQTATDLAALAAATNLATASAATSSSVAANGFAAADIAAIEPGTYVADASVAASQRFSTSAGGTPNAVRVTLAKVHHYVFGPLIGYLAGGAAVSDPTVTTRSVAAARNIASFSLGSGLASVNQGIANSVLGGLTGSSVSLSANDYQSLASTNINLFTFANALAMRVGATVGTYGSLASLNVSLGNAVMSLAQSAATTPAYPALAALAVAVGAGRPGTLTLGSLVSYGPYQSLPIGSAGPITATVSALNLVSAMLQAANGLQQVESSLAISIPGILSAKVKLAIGEPAVGSSLIAVGAQGSQLTTAETRLRLTLQVAGPPPASIMTVPIVVDLATATAALASIQCSAGPSTATVQLGVTPGVAAAWIGSVSDQDLTNLASPLNPASAPLVNLLGLISVYGYAHASIANSSAVPVNFSSTDITNATRKTVSTTDFLAPLLTSLFSNLQLATSVLGYSPLNTSALNLSIMQTLTPEIPAIDTMLASTLAVLGVSVGNATTWVSGVQCGQSVLVN